MTPLHDILPFTFEITNKVASMYEAKKRNEEKEPFLFKNRTQHNLRKLKITYWKGYVTASWINHLPLIYMFL